jgi:hypothetical protein
LRITGHPIPSSSGGSAAFHPHVYSQRPSCRIKVEDAAGKTTRSGPKR